MVTENTMIKGSKVMADEDEEEKGDFRQGKQDFN